MSDGQTSSSPQFTIVIPAYNRAEFLGMAIKSVLDQTIDPALVEIVVVDDGSTDKTPDVAGLYQQLYPDRVRLISKANGGVASALNAGVRNARGSVIGFMGSDDMLGEEALELVAAFFAKHGEEVDLAAIGLFMFGARSGPHWNNRSRFDSTRVIDVKKQWNLIHPAGGGTFIKVEVFDEISFDERLFINEDGTLNTQVIMRKMKYGVVAGARYLNRRYPAGGSLVSSSHFRQEFYTEVPVHAYQRMLDAGRELHGDIPRYAQAMVACDLTWRFRGDLSAMDPSMEEPYRALLKGILQQLSVEVIMAQRAPIEVRLAMLNLRADGGLPAVLKREGLAFSVDGVPVYSLEATPGARHRPVVCDIKFFEAQGDSVVIEGHFRAVEVLPVEYAFVAGGRNYPVDLLPSPEPAVPRLLDDLVSVRPFRARVELLDGETLAPVVRVEGVRAKVAPRMFRHTRFSGSPALAYYRRDGRTVYRLRPPAAIIRQDLSIAGVIRAELGLALRALRASVPRSDVWARFKAEIRQLTRHKQIWLMGDHKSEAGDNGEAMFRHLAANPPSGVEPFFVLRKEAREFQELSKLGRVVEPNSPAHLQAYIDATVVMNSAGDEYMLDPLGNQRTVVNDLVKGRRVFLQHGVTKDDQSRWLNHWDKGFDVFVTSAQREYESIVEGGYDYRPEQVVLTGMPRLDRLSSEPDRLIVLAPTWRKGLTGSLDTSTGRVRSSASFGDHEYYLFWQEVISNTRLTEVMRAKDYRGVFALHPSHAAEAFRFKGTDRITVGRYPHDYRDLFNRGEVLVTDYSSVAFDFAYLRKPVVYAQGDRDEFFAGHLYSQGYFSYDDDGFGPVTRTVDELVEELVSLILDGCEMDDLFRRRVDDFFAFEGGGNSERVVAAINASLQAQSVSG